MQRSQRRAGHYRSFGAFGRRTRQFGSQCDVRVDCGVELVDTREKRFSHLDRRDLLLAHQGGKLGRRSKT
jgi:hypothetical protein